MSTKEPDNRRRFFRITDALGVSYKVMTETEMAANNEEGDDAVVRPFVDTFSVMKNYNDVLNTSLENIKTRDPDTATAIEQLNKKFDALLMMLELDSLITQRACHRVEEASISASGIAFPIEESLEPDVFLALDLLLRPSSKHVNVIGKVISCEKLTEDSHYYLRVEFTEMSDKDRETLIQHIVQRQGTLLRALKDEVDD
jgi:hypothetical protein